PTGAEIALPGYQLDCPVAEFPSVGTSYSPAYTLPLFQRQPGLVTIYNTQTGKLEAQLHPGADIRHKIPVLLAVQRGYTYADGATNNTSLEQLARSSGRHELCRDLGYACVLDRPESTPGASGGGGSAHASSRSPL